MCIIAIKPKGKKMFDDDTIATMFSNNPDGSGYMYYSKKDKKVVIRKGYMTLKSLLASLHSQDLTNTNVILHFRIGTSGKMDALNCHPYPVYQKNDTKCKTDLGVAHNGILYDYTPSKNSKINDTQVFIAKVLSNLSKGFQYDTDKLALINELIGTNKLAFLDDKNKITTIGNFITDGGYMYSNTTYKKKTYTHACTKKSVNKDDKDDYGWWDNRYQTYYDKYYTKDIFGELTDETGFWRDFDNNYLY